MRKPLQLFISESGDPLPRWQEAFPRAVCVPRKALSVPHGPIELVWLRVHRDAPVGPQIGAIRENLGDRRCPFVILSDLPDDEEALAAFSAAARGYVNSHADPAVLKQVSAVVLQGGLWIGASLMERLLVVTSHIPAPESRPESAATQGLPPPRRWSDDLTPRELEVARIIAAGASNKEIARQLGITERTVKAHVGAVFEKLHVRDRLQLAILIKSTSFPGA